MAWEVKSVLGDGSVSADKERLAELLAEGWEPYAATGSSSSWRIHLRRSYVLAANGETRIYRSVI